MELKENLKICHDYMNKANRIVVTTHMNPDGDAVGSALALYHYLLNKGKDVSVITDGEIPYDINFLDGNDEIRVFDEKRDHETIMNAELIIIADLNNLKRLRSVENSATLSQAQKIVIDHHIDPKEFADHYCIDTDASSTGEIIWKLLDMDRDYEITKSVAEALYVAIMTDTGSFRFNKTDGEVHRIIANLLDRGANPSAIYDRIYNNVPVNVKKLNGLTLSTIELFFDGRLCMMQVTDEMFQQTETSGGDVEGFVEQSLSIEGVMVGILLTEITDRDEVRISFRSKDGYAVRDLAVELGGGGHVNAAGARVKFGKIEELKQKILTMAEPLFS